MPKEIKKNIHDLVIGAFLLDIFFIAGYYIWPWVFNLDGEQNLTTLYQSAKLILLAFIALHYAFTNTTNKLEKYTWSLVAMMIMYIGIDEWLQLHEMVSHHTHLYLLDTSGPVKYAAWIIAYTPLIVSGIGLLLLATITVLKKERRSRNSLLFLIGVLCFGLVPILEILGTTHDTYDATYTLLVAIEEGLEMLGVSFFLSYLTYSYKALSSPQELQRDSLLKEDSLQ